jgi:hypothetical protein
MGSKDDTNGDESISSAKRAVRYNEKSNVPDQTEKEEAETRENAPVEHLADEKEIKRRKTL